MAYDEKLAGRVRKLLTRRQGFAEKKMFGGLCFMLHSKMVCGVLKEDLVLRVGPGGCRTEKSLSSWITGAIEYASTLPKNSKRKMARC